MSRKRDNVKVEQDKQREADFHQCVCYTYIEEAHYTKITK